MLKETILGVSMVTVSLVAAQSAFAGADCPEAPRSEWMSEADMQKKILNDYGFSIQKFKVDGNCYEIYGKESGKRIEVYFNPVNGEIVKKKMKD